jgi:coiled-coil domain-containing protein 12
LFFFNLQTILIFCLHFRPSFRNYKPDEDLKVTEDTKLPSIEEDIKDHLEEMKNPLEVKDIDITNLAPKKVDFDLKRSINKRLQKLEKRTQKAISELIRERLTSQGDSTLLENVNIGAQQTQKHAEDDDSD